MAFLMPLIGAGASLLGGLFGNKQNAGPQLTSGQKALRDQLTSTASSQLTNLPQDISGYFSNALYGNAANQRTQQNALQRTLASRGLAASPLAASSMMNMQMQGANQNQQLINQMPLLKMQLLQQALASSGNAFRNTMAGNQMQQQQSLGLGGALGSALGSFGTLASAQPGGLAGLFGLGGGMPSAPSFGGSVSAPSSYNMVTSMGLPSAPNYFGGTDYAGTGDLNYG